MIKNEIKLISSRYKHRKKECNVVLSSGGVRALTHIGVLQALEEEGWTVKNICGISAGAIVASSYANGLPLNVMERQACNADFSKFKKLNFPKLNQGLFKFNGLGDWAVELSKATKNREVKRRCDLHIVTCSLDTGDKWIITNPEDELLSKAIEATCCIPVIFKPTEINGEKYVDGALWSAAPAHFYYQFFDSNLITFLSHAQSSQLYKFQKLNNPIYTLYRVFEIFQLNRLKSLKKRVSGKPVCIIEPADDFVSPLDLKLSKSMRKKIIQSGREVTLNKLREGIYDVNGVQIF